MNLRIVRRIAARPSIVFDALVTPEGMISWWGPDDLPAVEATSDARAGGRYEVKFRTLDGLEHHCSGHYLEVVRFERIVMSWNWISGGVPEERGATSRVELRLRAIETGTELTVIHSALQNQASASNHERGWNGALDKLVRYLTAN
jgi:uncharacterized protein YndB with AHSA1/START domain